MKILCKRCKNTVAHAIGKLVSIKRRDQLILINGDDFSIIATCSRNCGNQTDIIMDKGKLITDNLLLDKGDKNEKKENKTNRKDDQLEGEQPKNKPEEKKQEKKD